MSFFKVRPLSNLKKTIIQNIAFMIAIGIVVFLIIYTFMSHYLKDSIETEENNVSAKAATQFSDYFSQISSYSFNLSNTYTIPNSSLSDYQPSVNSSIIQNNILSHIVSSKFMSAVKISDRNGISYSSGTLPQLSNYNTHIGQYINCDIYLNTDKYTEGIMFKYLSDSAKFNEVNIILKSSYLSDLLLKDNMYVVNDQGKIILCTDNDTYSRDITDIYGIEKEFSPQDFGKNESKYHISLAHIEKSNLYVVLVIPIAKYYNRFAQILFTSLSLSLIIMAVSVFILLQSWRKVYNKVNTIVETLKYHYPNDSINIDELAYINSSIQKTLEQNQKSQAELSTAVLKLRTSQAMAVYSQISPHFISNTLENIKSQSIIALGIKNNISRSIVLLNRIISEYINQQDMFTSLKNEIEITKTYVELSNLKFKIPFSAEYDIESGAENALIIKLTIQPFIENTVIHSFLADKPDQHISIRAYFTDDKNKLRLEISDNGPGIPKEKLEHIWSVLKSPDLPESHIGMKNVDIRYKLLYGDDYGITDIISSTKGTTILFTLPAEKHTDYTPIQRESENNNARND